MKKNAKKFGLVIGIILFIGIIGFGYFVGMTVFDNSIVNVDAEPPSFEKVNFDIEQFESSYGIEQIAIESTLDGHDIPADYITINGKEKAPTIIMIHGLGDDRKTYYPVADMLLKNGYNILSYDQRNSGDNVADYTTYGYLEQHDLLDYVTYLDEILDENQKLGILGFSLGSQTAGIYLGTEHANEHIDFAILDSPLSNMSYVISSEMQDVGIPLDFLMFTGNLVTRLKLGFSYEDTNVLNYIDKTEVPILIINSKADTVTPYFMGEEIYNTISHSNKEMFTVDDSKHVEIFSNYPREYEKNIMDFIR